MRRLFLALLPLVLVVLAAASSAPAGLVDRELAGSGSTLALVNGRGTAIVNARSGSLLGKVGTGRIVVVNRGGSKTTVRVGGCEKTRRPDSRTIVCIGRGLRATVLNGSWRVTLKGRRINASSVAEGVLRLRGTRGRFAIDSGPSRKWPRTFRAYRLG